jgi:hypothetical protein
VALAVVLEAEEAVALAVVLEAEEAVAPLPALKPAFRLWARHLLEDAGQAVLPLPQAVRAEAVVCAAAQRCRDCR